MQAAGDRVVGETLRSVRELKSPMGASVLNGLDHTVDAFEQDIFAEQGKRGNFGLCHITAQQRWIPVIAKPQFGVQVSVPLTRS